MRAAALALLLAAAGPAAAQDTLRLGPLQDAAVRRDPRVRQLELQETASALRIRTLETERLPQLTLRGEATHQSEVPAIPISLPGGAAPPVPPKDHVSAGAEVQQLVYDGGVVARRREVERAQLQVARAEVMAALHPLREEVTEAFFAAFLLQERAAETRATMGDLEARLGVLRSQVRAGAALAGDTALVTAEVLRAGQALEELAADRRAALAVLASLTGTPVADAAVLELPGLADEVTAARAAGGPVTPPLRERPEYARFSALRQRLAEERALVTARARPTVSAFGTWSYGKPGYAQFRDDLHDYWMAGVRVAWSPWTWGRTGREREGLAVQQRIADTEEAAFTARLGRQVEDEVQAMARLEGTLETDERIIALRAQVERQARAQFEERAITADRYVEARTDLQEARLARQRHRVELARARARYLTTLGVEIR
jgi:outer membrane protein TolC